MSNGIADYLMEFHLDKGSEKGLLPSQRSIVAPHEEELRTSELIRNAEMRARQEERLASERMLEVALAAERASAEERLRSERNRWANEEAGKLSAHIAESLRELNRELNERMARILRPVLNATIRDQVLSELAQTLETLFSNNGGIMITISGPEDLVQALQQRVEFHDRDVRYVFLEQPDIRIVANETIIETQLNMWLGRVANAVQSS